jgi:uncharacterized tellurite resistance protein B-like protein
VSLFVLPIALLALLLVLLLVLSRAVFGALRSALLLQRVRFSVNPPTARPGTGVRVTAEVVPRGSRLLSVRAVLACTLFDYRPRELYRLAVELSPVHGRPHELAAFVRIPSQALRSGVVGDGLSQLFSEDAHRLLVSWSLDLEVRDGGADGALLHVDTIPLEVPEGRPLQPDRGYMDALLGQVCAETHSELLFNWMVRLALVDGTLSAPERDLLLELLRNAYGITDPAEADARIQAELRRQVEVDPTLLRNHFPPERLAAVYRFLFAMAWRDGTLDGREHSFLRATLERFGLDRQTVASLEREVLVGYGRHALG